MLALGFTAFSYVTPTVDVIEEISDFLTESPNSMQSIRNIQGEWD